MSMQNISMANVKGKCDLKCSYAFKYSESNSSAKNNGVTINLTYDSSNVPPVVFNQEKYQVSEIKIVCPSIHLFNNTNTPGEIIITHTPTKGGNLLEVCIPLTSSSESSTASQIVTDIITKVATNAPSDGDSTNLNMNFNLQEIVPRKPFFTYSQDRNTWIVYGVIDAIPLSSSTLSTLEQIIKPFPLPTLGGDLFYNSKGPISGVQLGNGIYISCQPTGSSKEETAVEYDKTPSSTAVDFSNIFDSPIFKVIISILIGGILFFVIFYGVNSFFNYLSSETPKLPSFPKFR